MIRSQRTRSRSRRPPGGCSWNEATTPAANAAAVHDRSRTDAATAGHRSGGHPIAPIPARRSQGGDRSRPEARIASGAGQRWPKARPPAPTPGTIASRSRHRTPRCRDAALLSPELSMNWRRLSLRLQGRRAARAAGTPPRPGQPPNLAARRDRHHRPSGQARPLRHCRCSPRARPTLDAACRTWPRARAEHDQAAAAAPQPPARRMARSAWLLVLR